MTGSERTIFLEALDLADPPERAAFLDRACGGKDELRHRVERLIEALDGAGDFMESPGVTGHGPDFLSPEARPILEGPGTRIGPYKLLEAIGEGGMGVVYMAEQSEPVRRRVAVKIIKPGMDSAQVIARFEAERQALAMMDHPNIARVLDAGTTDTGRPYFVMELVKGVPITEYCDRNQLSLRERLELFAPVCRAIQHAHQKGIIHRDVKPSNVMVTLYDGKPVPKVIDFGVAKAIDQQLTEKTLFTRFGVVVGTLEYMSPEQAELGAPDVDTRSDIYSLGVLLYELLTGSTPLERARLRQAAYSEILRKIREDEPPRPSARLSESREALASISEQRKTEPVRLAKLVRGELDWIVMKALDKDRSRRYDSANGFALDVERYLRNEVVAAGPPSAAYRLRKRMQRLTHGRGAAMVATVAVILTLLLVGAIGTTIVAAQRARAMQAMALARAEADRARHEIMQQQAAGPKVSEAQAVLDFFKQNVLAGPPSPGPGGKPGAGASGRAALERAEAALASSPVAEPAVEASIRTTLGETYLGLGERAKAIHHLEQALALRRQALGLDSADTLKSMDNLAEAYMADGQIDGARPLYEEALAHGKRVMGADHLVVLSFMNHLGRAYLASEPAFAEPVLREALAGWMRKAGHDWHTYEAASQMGGFLLIQKNYAGAEPYLLQGYQGLKDREGGIPEISRRRIDEARARIIALYDAWGKPEKAAEWRKKQIKPANFAPQE